MAIRFLNKTNNSGGFVKLLLIIVVVVIILGYYRVDIRNIIESDLVQRNLNYLWDLAKEAWNWLYAKIAALADNFGSDTPELPE